ADLLRGGERKGGVRQVRFSQATQKRPRVGSHDTEDAEGARDIDQAAALFGSEVAADPIGVTHSLRGAGDEVEFVRSQTHESQVAFESAALVEEAGVNGFADRD